MDNLQIALAIFSFFLGVTAKYADLYNEHGLHEPFKYASGIFGLLWGVCGAGMIYVSPLGGLTYIAHILYWFARVKLEYFNHAIAGVIMLLSAFWFQGDFLMERRWDLLCVFFAYWTTGYVQLYFKTHYPASRPFWRLRLRIYLIPLVYAYIYKSIDPIIATGFGMVGCEIITNSYRKYAEDRRMGVGSA